MFLRHALDKMIIGVVVLVILVVISYRPAYRLRNDMPSAFFKATATEAAKTSLDERIAWGYWESAVMDVQWRYSRVQPLPPEPPAEFHLNAEALGPVASDPATRLMYWKRLQQIWLEPSTWTQHYEWNWTWVHDPIDSAGSWIRHEADRLFTISR